MTETNIGKNVFRQLYDIDTRERAVEKDTGRSKLEYLPWAVTYSEVAKNFEDMEYGFDTYTKDVSKTTTITNEDGSVTEYRETYIQVTPYNDTPSGLEVSTWVTINGKTKKMRLPVYDANYRTMKSTPYTYETKNGTKTVPAATMADIYKSIMRCFAKNLSMWGVGLNFWTKEEATETVLNVEKLVGKIDTIYLAKKKKGFTDEELLAVCKDNLPEDLGGNYHLCDNEEMLETLQKKLLTLIKPTKKEVTEEAKESKAKGTTKTTVRKRNTATKKETEE